MNIIIARLVCRDLENNRFTGWLPPYINPKDLRYEYWHACDVVMWIILLRIYDSSIKWYQYHIKE